MNEASPKDTIKTILDATTKSKLKIRLWTCPEGCKGIIDWDGDIATCGVCGRKSDQSARLSMSENLSNDHVILAIDTNKTALRLQFSIKKFAQIITGAREVEVDILKEIIKDKYCECVRICSEEKGWYVVNQ